MELNALQNFHIPLPKPWKAFQVLKNQAAIHSSGTLKQVAPACWFSQIGLAPNFAFGSADRTVNNCDFANDANVWSERTVAVYEQLVASAL